MGTLRAKKEKDATTEWGDGSSFFPIAKLGDKGRAGPQWQSMV